MLWVENKIEGPRIVDEFDRVCNRRKLRDNIDKSNVIVFERENSKPLTLQRAFKYNSWLGKGR